MKSQRYSHSDYDQQYFLCNTVPVTFGVNTCLVSANKGFRLFGTSCKKYMDTFGNLSPLFSPFKSSFSISINNISILSVVLVFICPDESNCIENKTEVPNGNLGLVEELVSCGYQ